MTREEKKIGEFQLSNTLFASGAPIVVPSFCVCMRVIRRRGKKTAKEKKIMKADFIRRLSRWKRKRTMHRSDDKSNVSSK